MSLALALPLLLAAPPLPIAKRVDGARAVEKARYTFVIGATKPFDDVYPRSVFEKKVRRELAEERVLSSRFGMKVTPELLSAEYERIEKETRAPDQWEAIKKELGDSRRRAEEIVCRPLLVDRALRARFAFDQKIHEAEHQRARKAREEFLAGKSPKGSRAIRLSRKVETGGTDDLLARARSEASAPIVAPEEPGEKSASPVPVDPEMAKALEKELKQKGDVSTILEERNRFSVFRLVTSDPGEWLVEAVQIPKRDFDRWLDAAARAMGPPG